MRPLSMLLVAGVVLSVALATPRALARPAHAASAPANWQGEYFNNRSFSGAPVLTRDDGPSIDFHWDGSPAAGVGDDGFSVRWTQTQAYPAGTYRFDFTHDDHGRLFVDGQPVMEHWFMRPPTAYTASVDLGAGMHTITVEYSTTYGEAVARLVVARTSAPEFGGAAVIASSAVTGWFFDNASLVRPSALSRDEGASLEFAWTADLEASLNTDAFSATWRQFVVTTDGVYRVSLSHDDGARLKVDGALLIDHWFTQSAATYSVDVALSRGIHTIVVDYYHRWGPSTVKMQFAPVSSRATPTATSTSSPLPTATSTSTATPPPIASTATPTPTAAPASQEIALVTPGPPAAPAATSTPPPPTPPAATPTATLTPTQTPRTAGDASNSPQTMVDDAALAHEGCLDKNYVDGFSWQYSPDTDWWNPSPPAGYGALTGWFAVTTDASPTCTTQVPVDNVRIEVRGFRTYALVDGAWRLVQDQATGGLGSGLYFPDYQSGWGDPNVRSEPDGGQSWLPGSRGLWHGWPGWRAAIPTGTTAVCSQFEARLVLDDPAGPDNRWSARMLAEAGFDWWQSTTSGSNELGMNGRYKLVPQDGSYRWFNGCSAPAATLLSSPPPYE